MKAREMFYSLVDRVEALGKTLQERDNHIDGLKGQLSQLRVDMGTANNRNHFGPVRYSRSSFPFPEPFKIPEELNSAGDTVLVWANEADLLRMGREIK